MTIPGLKTCIVPVQTERGSAADGRMAWSRLSGCDAVLLYVGIRPVGAGDARRQAEGVYGLLDGLLGAQGASRHQVITEKVFFADLQGDVDSYRAVRERYYLGGNGHAGSVPATSYVEQPPAGPGVRCELQARVMIPVAGEPLTVRDIAGLPAPAAGKVVSARGYDHLYLQNLTGGGAGDGMGYAEQTAAMFELAQAALDREQLSFRDVIRTWIYVDQMEQDYAALNQVRTAFFEQARVRRLPASTGIQGRVYPADRGGSMDVYALRTGRPVEISVMHAETLNEASSYGSAFSRGLAVRREDRTELYVSGTASIDNSGQVVHVGDAARQSERMLLNVRELLAGSGAEPTDIVRATTYLKSRADLDAFQHVYADQGFPGSIPHTICEAAVCRPTWLVEIEVAAVLSPA